MGLAMKCYCLFCRAGAEEKFVKSLSFLLKREYASFDDLSVIFPVRVVQEKRQGKWRPKVQPVLPGYVFLYLDDDDPFPSFQARQCEGYFRVLKYPDGHIELKGTDLQYAEWIRSNKGTLQPSRISLDLGNRITVISGPMKDMQGKVVKLDRHKKRVIVAFEFAGEVRHVNLSVEIVSKGGSGP
jgi:transcriptional antiterminator NusG